jgi:hypothetical protein
MARGRAVVYKHSPTWMHAAFPLAVPECPFSRSIFSQLNKHLSLNTPLELKLDFTAALAYAFDLLHIWMQALCASLEQTRNQEGTVSVLAATEFTVMQQVLHAPNL